jgi:hypothetical protein
MTNFQLLADSVLLALIAWETVGWLRRMGSGGFCLVRLLVWTAAALAITFPDSVQRVALFFGVGRGADVVLYLFVLTFLAVSFFLYARYRRLEQRLTLVVRHLALREAVKGEGLPVATAANDPG